MDQLGVELVDQLVVELVNQWEFLSVAALVETLVVAALLAEC